MLPAQDHKRIGNNDTGKIFFFMRDTNATITNEPICLQDQTQVEWEHIAHVL